MQGASSSQPADLPVPLQRSTGTETDLPSPTPASPGLDGSSLGVNTSLNFVSADNSQPSVQPIALAVVPFSSGLDDPPLMFDAEEEINILPDTASLAPLSVVSPSGSDLLGLEPRTAVDTGSSVTATTAIVLWGRPEFPDEGVSIREGCSGGTGSVTSGAFLTEEPSNPLLLSHVIPSVAAYVPEPPSFADSSRHFCSAPLFSVPPNDVVRHIVTAMIDTFLERVMGDHRFPSLPDFKECIQKITPALLSLGVSESVWQDFCMGMENDIALVEEHQRLLSEGSSLENHERGLSTLSGVLADVEAHIAARDAVVKEGEAAVQEFQYQRFEAMTSYRLLRDDLRRVDDEISALITHRRDIVQRLEEVAEHASSISNGQRGAEQILQQNRVESETWKMFREDTLAAQSVARSVLADLRDKRTMSQRIIADCQKKASTRASCFRSSFKNL